MSDMLIVEGIGTVSMRNGIVRVQCLSTSADGKDQVSGELLIPAMQFNRFSAGLQDAGKQLQEKVEEARKNQQAETVQ